MNIDLHCHIKLSKKQQFSLTYFQQSIAEAKAAGLDAIAMTEHFNTNHFYDIYEQLNRHYKYVEHYYDVDGFKVFPGMEIDVANGGHILVMGSRDNILMLRHMLAPHEAKDSFVDFKQLLDWCDELDLMRIGAHPYRESNPLTAHSPELLRRLHAFDMNGKDLYSYGEQMQQQVAQLAAEIGIPYTVGSDTHHPLQFGAVFNRFEVEIGSYADLRAALQQGQYSIHIAQDLQHRVKAASLVKKLLKERGDVTAAFI